MHPPRKDLLQWVEQGLIADVNLTRAVQALRIHPDGTKWFRFLDKLLLSVGLLCIGFAVLFLVAYNWDGMGRIAKFGLLESLLAFLAIAYYFSDMNALLCKLILLLMVLFTGILLALFGQVYQTGADDWQLFFYWAVLITPWVLSARFSVLWLVWLALFNLAIIQYYQAFHALFGWHSETVVLWAMFFINIHAMLFFEYFQLRCVWLSNRWLIRLLALVSGVAVTWLALSAIHDFAAADIYSWLAWFVWLSGMMYFYRNTKLDLFMLTGCCFSLITVTVTFLGYHLGGDSGGGVFLLLAILTIAAGSLAAQWLKKVYLESL